MKMTPTYVADLAVGQTVRWHRDEQRTIASIVNIGGRPPKYRLTFTGIDTPATLFGSGTLQVFHSEVDA